MQFALPPRKSPHAHPYPRSSRVSFQRRRQLKAAAVLGFALLSVLFLLSRFSSSSDTESAAIFSSAPEVVLVTVLDRDVLSKSYIEKVKKNREYYAARHGYTNFFANTSDYEYTLNNVPRSWAVIPAVRHAMTQHPHSAYFFHLSPHSLIMNPSVSIKSLVTDSKRLESLMIKDVPVVPPDSVIRTFSHLKGQDVDLILTQDKEDLSSGSFILRQGTWGKYFLDVWFDPLYRDYNFAKAETHALDHIVQWHPTILAKLALVPQRIINAYSRDSNGATADGTYKDGDFLIRAMGCDTEAKRNCEQELEPYYSQWLRSISR